MASIKKRKDKDGKIRYHVQVRLKGHPSQYATFRRETDAKKWVQQTEVAIREGRHFKTNEAKKHTLAEMIDRYIKTIFSIKEKYVKSREAQLLWWKKQIGSKLLFDITPSLIGEQRDKLLSEMTSRKTLRSNATVVRYLAALSHVFTIAVKEWGWLEDSPMRKVRKPKEPRGRVRFLSDEEREKLLAVCKTSTNSLLYTVVVLALSTGMRQGEIMSLKWSDVDLKRGRIILDKTKNNERRAVPIAGHALQLLHKLDKVRYVDTMLLFPGKNRKDPMDLRFPWQAALRVSGIKDFRFHDLRHSCASYLAMNGASLAEIAEILGHKTLSMVKRYTHLSESHTAEVVASMNERFFSIRG